MFILIIVVVIALLLLIFKPTKISCDNVCFVSGGCGSGKTRSCVSLCKSKYKKNLRIVKFSNFFKKLLKRPLDPLPLFMSTIPIYEGKKCISVPFSFNIVLELEKLPFKSILYMTEAGKYFSQWFFKYDNMKDNISDYFTLFRQYTKGGFLCFDDQSSDRVAVEIRRACGSAIQCSKFHSIGKIYWNFIRVLNIGEDVSEIPPKFRIHFGLFPLFYRDYDTYAFSERLSKVPYIVPSKFASMKTNTISSMPLVRVFPLRSESDLDLKVFKPSFDWFFLIRLFIYFIAIILILR